MKRIVVLIGSVMLIHSACGTVGTKAQINGTQPQVASETASETGLPASSEVASLSPDDIAAIQSTITEYAALMTEKNYRAAGDLLTGRLRESYDPSDFDHVGIEKMTISSARIERIVSPSEVVVDVILDITLASEAATAYDNGENERWFHMTKVGGAWKITEMASSPF